MGDQKRIRGRNGTEYNGNLKISYLFKPYILYNETNVIFGESGTGKGFLIALFCAYASQGWMLPGDDRAQKPKTVLYISSEETFDELMDRITKAGGDPGRCFIIDKIESQGMNFDDGYSELSETIEYYHPDMVILDPWQTFVGERVDMNRMNQMRPLMQKLSLLASNHHCAVVLVSHVNKRAQGENANAAASGSSELINASRSAIKVIFDETDENCRIAVHTKANHSKHGQSLRYRFTGDGAVVWDGFSEVTKQTLEIAARQRKTPSEVIKASYEQDAADKALIAALLDAASQTETRRYTYDWFRERYGNVFGSAQPKRVLDGVAPAMIARGYRLETGKKVKCSGETPKNGFFISPIGNQEPEEPEDQIEMVDGF